MIGSCQYGFTFALFVQFAMGFAGFGEWCGEYEALYIINVAMNIICEEETTNVREMALQKMVDACR